MTRYAIVRLEDVVDLKDDVETRIENGYVGLDIVCMKEEIQGGAIERAFIKYRLKN